MTQQESIVGRPERYGAAWERDELILAFDLYCRIPFQRTKQNNPAVRELAGLLQRSPASVARKLGNFGAFDPELQRRDISGLGHGSKQDEEIWGEFHHDWNGLVFKAHELRERLTPERAGDVQRLPPMPAAPVWRSEVVREVKRRVHQGFFRQVILSSYGSVCCVTGLPVEACLVASPIVPWSESESLRTDPRNGLCLSATVDRLFDRGLPTVRPDLRVELSGPLRADTRRAVIQQLHPLHGVTIAPPHRFLPSADHLRWHNEHVFQV